MKELKALQLVQEGYHDIHRIRGALRDGSLRLTRNQCVGVDCYEDLVEDMSREEVEAIGNLVINTFQTHQYPDAVGIIMGSYRRGKSSSGDVDVLLTIEKHSHDVPRGALCELVDHLWKEGHVAYHLTLLPGLKTGMAGVHRNEQVTASSSYMGVFNSPVVPRKRRRVDIKIYPYMQRAFACLYFTGSAHFNRSMRLWAKQKFNIKLTDRGLFDISTGKQISEARDEKQVFDHLNLYFKEPHERVCFDDVVPWKSCRSEE